MSVINAPNLIDETLDIKFFVTNVEVVDVPLIYGDGIPRTLQRNTLRWIHGSDVSDSYQHSSFLARFYAPVTNSMHEPEHVLDRKSRSKSHVFIIGRDEQGRSTCLHVKGFKPVLHVSFTNKDDCARAIFKSQQLIHADIECDLDSPVLMRTLFGFVPSTNVDCPGAVVAERPTYYKVTFPVFSHRIIQQFHTILEEHNGKIGENEYVRGHASWQVCSALETSPGEWIQLANVRKSERCFTSCETQFECDFSQLQNAILPGQGSTLHEQGISNNANVSEDTIMPSLRVMTVMQGSSVSKRETYAFSIDSSFELHHPSLAAAQQLQDTDVGQHRKYVSIEDLRKCASLTSVNNALNLFCVVVDEDAVRTLRSSSGNAKNMLTKTVAHGNVIVTVIVVRSQQAALNFIADVGRLYRPDAVLHFNDGDLMHALNERTPLSLTPWLVPISTSQLADPYNAWNEVDAKVLFAQYYPKADANDLHSLWCDFVNSEAQNAQSRHDQSFDKRGVRAEHAEYFSSDTTPLLDRIIQLITLWQRGDHIHFLMESARLSTSPISSYIKGGHSRFFWSSLFMECAKRSVIVNDNDICMKRMPDKLKGGSVFSEGECITHSPVIQLDFKSHYPTIIVDANLCPSTLFVPTATYKKPSDVFPSLTGDRDEGILPFSSSFTRRCFLEEGRLDGQSAFEMHFLTKQHTQGILPTIIDRLKRARADAIQLIGRSEDGAAKISLQIREKVLKRNSNALYGVTRLFAPQISHVITFIGRVLLQCARWTLLNCWSPSEPDVKRRVTSHLEYVKSRCTSRRELANIHKNIAMIAASEPKCGSIDAVPMTLSSIDPHHSSSSSSSRWPIRIVKGDTDGLDVELSCLYFPYNGQDSQEEMDAFDAMRKLAVELADDMRAAVHLMTKDVLGFETVSLSLDAVFHPFINLSGAKAYAGLRIDDGECNGKVVLSSIGPSRGTPLFIGEAVKIFATSYLTSNNPSIAFDALKNYLIPIAECAATPLNKFAHTSQMHLFIASRKLTVSRTGQFAGKGQRRKHVEMESSSLNKGSHAKNAMRHWSTFCSQHAENDIVKSYIISAPRYCFEANDRVAFAIVGNNLAKTVLHIAAEYASMKQSGLIDWSFYQSALKTGLSSLIKLIQGQSAYRRSLSLSMSDMDVLSQVENAYLSSASRKNGC